MHTVHAVENLNMESLNRLETWKLLLLVAIMIYLIITMILYIVIYTNEAHNLEEIDNSSDEYEEFDQHDCNYDDTDWHYHSD